MKKIITIILVCLLLATATLAYRHYLVFVVKPDLNNDGCVDMMDFAYLANHINSKCGEEEYKFNMDFNKDCKIDDKDVDIWGGFYEIGCNIK